MRKKEKLKNIVNLTPVSNSSAGLANKAAEFLEHHFPANTTSEIYSPGARPIITCKCTKYSDQELPDGTYCSYWRCNCTDGSQWAVNNCFGWHVATWSL